MSSDDIAGPNEPGNVVPFGTKLPKGVIKNFDDATIIGDIQAEMHRYNQYLLTTNRDGSKRNAIQCRAAALAQNALIDAAAARFGRLNGWRRTEYSFRISDIGRGSGEPGCTDTNLFDHPLYFRAKARCAAIVCQPYGPAQDETAKALAAAHGVACHVPASPKASFHYPGHARFLVFTTIKHQIVWLREQMQGGFDGKYF